MVACVPSGVVQPLVYDADHFRQMVRQANAVALEVMPDGIPLGGDEGFVEQLEELAARAQQHFGIERTPTEWRFARPVLRQSS